MSRTNCQATLTGLINDHDLNGFIDHIRLFEDNEYDHQGNRRATVEFGYMGAKNRFKLTAVSNYPSLNDAIAAVRNANDLATTLDLAVKAMPATNRPPLPDWVARLSQAARFQNDMARTRGLAKLAIT